MDLNLALLVLTAIGVLVAVHAVRSRLVAHSSAAPEAQELANLLVAELKLYNTKSIQQAKRDRRLPAELLAEIANARSMYNSATSPVDRCDFFYQALVAIIADGDSTLIPMEQGSSEQL